MSEGKYSMSEGKDGGGKTDEGKASAIDAAEGNADDDTALLALVNVREHEGDSITQRAAAFKLYPPSQSLMHPCLPLPYRFSYSRCCTLPGFLLLL